MPGKAALFEWLEQAIDELKTEQATVNLHINGGSIDAEVVTLNKEIDGAGRLVTVKRTTTTHLRIERKGRVLSLAK